MTSKDISIICNYQESVTPINPNSSISFIDMKTPEDDEEYLRELRMKNRGLAIEAVLDDKVEEYENREICPDYLENITTQSSGFGIVSPMVHSIGLPKPSKFKSYDDLWNVVMNHIETNTQNVHPFMQKVTMGVNQSPNFSYTPDTTKTDEENQNARSRKLLSRIMMASNAIASTLTRRGPATFMIIGTDIVKELTPLFFNDRPKSDNKSILGNITDITVILSKTIKPNQIIVGRSESTTDAGGLILLNDMNNYYLTETRRTFYKNFIWFDVN